MTDPSLLSVALVNLARAFPDGLHILWTDDPQLDEDDGPIGTRVDGTITVLLGQARATRTTLEDALLDVTSAYVFDTGITANEEQEAVCIDIYEALFHST